MDRRNPSVTTERRDGMEFHVLREPSADSEAWILPEVGANCVSFVTSVGGNSLEVIRWPESWDAFRGHPTGWGAAVLFPFPGRIAAGKFRFGDHDYQLPISPTSRGNAVHGCVSDQPWTLVAADASDAAGAQASYRIGMDSHPYLSERYPFPFRLTMTITLRDGRLQHAFAAENLGNRPMPIGLGLHPYFPLPLGGDGSVDECEIWVDAPYYWPQEAAFPSGTPKKVEDAVNLRFPRSLRALAAVGIGSADADRPLNLLYSQFSDTAGAAPSSLGIRAGVRNPHAGREVVVEFDHSFPACVTYVPPTRDKVSFEPHTCLPNAFNIVNEGKHAGTISLGPHEFWRGSLKTFARAIAASDTRLSSQGRK